MLNHCCIMSMSHMLFSQEHMASIHQNDQFSPPDFCLPILDAWDLLQNRNPIQPRSLHTQEQQLHEQNSNSMALKTLSFKLQRMAVGTINNRACQFGQVWCVSVFGVETGIQCFILKEPWGSQQWRVNFVRNQP